MADSTKEIYEHYLNLISLLQDKQGYYSVEELASKLCYSETEIIKQICLLKDNEEIQFLICLEDEEEEMSEEDFAAFKKGKYNSRKIYAMFGNNDDYLYFLTSLEAFAVQSVLAGDDILINKMSESIRMKKLINQKDDERRLSIRKKLYEIIATQSVVWISFKYKGKNEMLQSYTVVPIHIVDVVASNNTYLVALYEGKRSIFEIQRIKGGILKWRERDKKEQEKIKTLLVNEKEQLIHDLQKMWGVDESPEIHIKLLIQAEGNILRKIRRDLLGKGNLVKHEADYIFEGSIKGINSMKPWIRSYGKAVLVLEPKELAQEMLRSAYKRKQYYEDGGL